MVIPMGYTLNHCSAQSVTRFGFSCKFGVEVEFISEKQGITDTFELPRHTNYSIALDSQKVSTNTMVVVWKTWVKKVASTR